MNKQLRPHQERALLLLRRSLGSGHRRPMLQAPTGFGKTLLAAAVVDGARRKGNRVIFVVPALSLIDQTVQAFGEEGIVEVGVMQGFHELSDFNQPVQVASVQTLMRRKIPAADVVVIDEAHRWFDFYGKWMADPEWAKIPFIGLSATPWTKGLGKHYDDLLIAATTKDLIEAGYLSRFRVFAPSHPDMSAVRTVAGDYHEGDLGDTMDRPELVADVVETWIKRGENRSTLCFAVNRAHAKNLQQQFESAGIRTGYIDAYTDRQERERVADLFHDGTYRVVCNVGCLTTGVDWDVRCIVLARPTKSEMLFTQIIGRGLRTADGKDDCLILDHSDTHLRLGFVTDIHHDALDDGKERGKQERKESLPKECPECAYLKPPRTPTCPQCGFKAEAHAKIACEDGDLVELTGRKPSKWDKESVLGQLKFMARQKGYAEGWASHKYREIFGVWPVSRHVPPVEPTPELLSWLKSRAIAFAKAREAQNARAA